MFGAAGFGDLVLSASHSFEFCARLRGDRAATRRPMLHKCNERWISERTKPLAARCGLSVSSGTRFRCRRRAASRYLPSVRRNAPEVLPQDS
jgi:hypothetical protein